MKREIFVSHDSKQLNIAVWEIPDAKAVVQLVHGMSEHIARYDDFAKFLNQNGFIVVGDDHRAHGLTDIDRLGKADTGDLFENTVQDEIALTNYIKHKYKLPVLLIGHSYGSFISQRYLSIASNEIQGCILCGSALMKGVNLNIGNFLANHRGKGRRKDNDGKIFIQLTFQGYDKAFKEGLNAWLNRDIEAVGRYNIDPLCNFPCSNGFYKYFFNGLKRINKQDNSKISKDFKLMIASGDMDFVGGKGKLVKKLYDRYNTLGIKPVLKLYPGARHEILNEINKDEVYNDFLNFLNDCL